MKPKIRPLSKLAAASKVRGDAEQGTEVHTPVHEDSNTASTRQFASSVGFGKRSIVFTGGGTAGHVTPNLALMAPLHQEGWQINYIGSKESIEESMITALNFPFYAIHVGKLRRYFSWKNFLDPFKIFLGMIKAFYLLRQLQPNVVFSKGGFVAFPVVFGAWLNRIPIIAHESDISPGLANRLSLPFVNKVCVTFAASKSHFKKQQSVEITGTPIRPELFNGDRKRGLARCQFNDTKPCLLVIGGSQGAVKLNRIIRACLPMLNLSYQVIHLCGKGKIDNALENNNEYYQLEYANDELADLLAAADIIISRAGANTLYEILALRKPHILVPLSAQVSRGDQLQNAYFFKKQGISEVIEEEHLMPETLMEAVMRIEEKKEEIELKMASLDIHSATTKILAIIRAFKD